MLSREDIYYALEFGGVNNWNGFEFAIEAAENDGFDWYDLSPEDRMTYLENAGVDNWSYYSEAIEQYGDSLED